MGWLGELAGLLTQWHVAVVGAAQWHVAVVIGSLGSGGGRNTPIL